MLDRLAAAIHTKAIIYIGDDVSDADAFTALNAMTDTRTVAVGVRSHELSETRFANCDVMVEGVAGATQFLSELRDLSRPA